MGERIIFCAGSSSDSSPGVPCLAVDTAAGNKPYRILVDPGREVRSGEDDLDDSDAGCDFSILDDKKVDAVVLTHCHGDHIGDTPRVIAEGVLLEGANVLSTSPTSEVLPRFAEDGKRPGCGYTDLDIHDLVNNRRKVVESPGPCEILPGLQTLWRPVGHTNGASSICIPFSNGKKGLVCGDMSVHDQPNVGGMISPLVSWPKEFVPDMLLTTDLTYGETGSRVPYQEEENRIIAQLRINYARGDKTVVAAFATGRGPGLIALCVKAGIPVYVDGMIRDTYTAFQARRWSNLDKLLPQVGNGLGITYIESEDHRRQIIEAPGPWVVITTGGMGDFGPIIHYLEKLLPDARTWFFFTSWLNPASNGYKLVNPKEWQKKARREGHAKFFIQSTGKRDRKKTTKLVPFLAGVDHFHLGSHIALSEFVNFVSEIVQIRDGIPLDLICLTHGSRVSKERAAILLKQFARQIVYGEKYTIIEIK